jgi:hypothetical protein
VLKIKDSYLLAKSLRNEDLTKSETAENAITLILNTLMIANNVKGMVTTDIPDTVPIDDAELALATEECSTSITGYLMDATESAM